MDRTALVLGATGGVGGETARALLAVGWKVRALARTPDIARGDIEWMKGDALDAETVAKAAKGVQAIVHAVNPPGYRDWDKVVLPMLDNSIAAARDAGARLALPGTIYNFDPASEPVLRPDTPQRPRTRKGAIRMEMERRLEQPGLRSMILRAGDYFGPRPGNNWFSQGLVTPGKPVRSILYPGRKGLGHAWAYLPDLGQAFARVLDREADLPDFARFHFAGHWIYENDIASAIAHITGRDWIGVRRMPWGLLPLVAPFNPTMREMIEMRPFWDHPTRLDNSELVAAIGEEPYTPFEIAVAAVLDALGCLRSA